MLVGPALEAQGCPCPLGTSVWVQGHAAVFQTQEGPGGASHVEAGSSHVVLSVMVALGLASR